MTSANNYDKYADKWQKKVLGDKHYAHNFLEKPAMYGKLPDLKGKSVLCLGCGSGEECFKIRDLGATSIIGLDNSKGLIQKAKYTYPNITFECEDIEKMNFEPESFDFVYSSLTMHYIEDWESVMKKIYSYLKPGGKFLFSTHHPAKWGGQTVRTKEFNQFVLGYKKNKIDDSYTIFGDYLNKRKINDTLFGELDVVYYNRSTADMFKDISGAGFTVSDIREPKPTIESKSKKPDFYEVYSRIPLFMIWELEKN